MVKVEILGCVMTAQYGTLSAGTILTTNEAFAKHLVDDCKAAKYVDAKPDDLVGSADAQPVEAVKVAEVAEVAAAVEVVAVVEVADPKPAKPAKAAK